MMPKAEDMLAAVQLALKEHVVPIAEGHQWAASALRSVDVILNHLQARVPVEGPILHADTTELLELLGKAKTALGDTVEGQDAFLTEAPAVLAGYATVGDLHALNHRGREVVDLLLRHCHARKGEEATQAAHADLRAYLVRHTDRESPFFFPTYVGRPV